MSGCCSNKKPVDIATEPEKKRCCGRALSEKCSPEEEAANTSADGKKSCCKGDHGHHHE